MIQNRFVLIFLVLLIGLSATLWGLSHMSWPTISLFAWSPIHRNVLTFMVVAVIIEVIARLFKIGRLTSGVATACSIAVFSGAIWPLLVSLWFALASYVLGLGILSVLKIDKDKLSGLIVFLIGAGAYGTAAGLSAHFPINYPGLYGVALAIPVIFGWRAIADVFYSLLEWRLQQVEFKWLDVSIVLVSLLHFTVALMPEVGHDALAAHLFVPGHMLHRHEWGFDVTTYVWAVIPMMGDWIFSIGYMLGGETTSRLINVGFIFVLSWLVHDLVLWAGGNALGARWSVLLFLTTPLIFLESSSLFIESVWASFVVAGVLSACKVLYSKGDQNIYLPVSGMMLGSALAAKAITLAVLPVFLLLLVAFYRVWLKINLVRAIVVCLALFIVMGAIPYVTAWYITGNPVFPFYNEFFQSPLYPAVNFSTGDTFEKGVSWDTIYRITFESGRYLESHPGAAGFQWLLLLLPAIVMFSVIFNRKGLTLIFVGILALVLTFYGTAYLRYVMPSFAILSAALGLFISLVYATGKPYLLRSVILISISAIVLNMVFFKSATYYGNIALQPLLSESDRYEYLENHLPIRNAVALVNQINISKSPVVIYASPLAAELSSDALYSNWYNPKFYALVQKADSTEAIASMMFSMGVEYVILDNNWGDPEKRQFIKEATKVVSDFGSISVRVLRQEFLFNIELLNDTDFSLGAWAMSNGAKKSTDGVIVNVREPVTQGVSVMPNGRYLLAVKASCLETPSQGRMQVNWMDSEGVFITTHIQVFDCTQEPILFSTEVKAPPEAVTAIIYATGHTEVPLIIHEVSFKK